VRRSAVLLLAAIASGLGLSGCVALAVPAVAGAAMGKRFVDSRSGRDERLTVTALPPGSTMPTPTAAAAQTEATPVAVTTGAGSAEAAAGSVQAWRELIRHVAAKVVTRPADSVVLAPGATLADPQFAPCGDRPLAAVFDIDDTVLRDGQVVPGAASALAALRAMGVAIVFNADRPAARAAATEAALDAAGLGPAAHGTTLFLSGDDATGAKKDGRRARIAARYCVIAQGGDQLGDFSDLFDAGLTPAARRSATLLAPLSAKWGAGWFILGSPAVSDLPESLASNDQTPVPAP